jgi:hypothetical protein
LEHLHDNGFVILEEPNRRPRTDPPVLKMLTSMRQALLDIGADEPADHFLIFHWQTDSNRYYQILFKKAPLTDTDIENFHRWLDDCNAFKTIRESLGFRPGPIASARCVPIYVPGEGYDNAFAQAVRGELDARFARRFEIRAATDDRPFPFAVDRHRNELRGALLTTAGMVLLLLPVPLLAGMRFKIDAARLRSYGLIAALTATGYLLIEVVLIQWFEIFLGNPIVSFACVLGTVLVASGVGSLVVGKLGHGGAWACVAGIVGWLALILVGSSALFDAFANHELTVRVVVSVLSMAPLGFLMGVPFPYVLRASKIEISPPAAAVLYGISGMFGALTVPLGINLTVMVGYRGTCLAAGLAYGASMVLLMVLGHPKRERQGWYLAAIVLMVLYITPLLPW